jgi:hypothetical protein
MAIHITPGFGHGRGFPAVRSRIRRCLTLVDEASNPAAAAVLCGWAKQPKQNGLDKITASSLLLSAFSSTEEKHEQEQMTEQQSTPAPRKRKPAAALPEGPPDP